MTQERNCENCAHYHMEAYEYPCNVCEASYDNPPTKWESEDKPQTNAEHIRGMTDEELAEAFGGSCICSYIQDHDNAFCKERAVCTNCIKDWLQQPYKED